VESEESPRARARFGAADQAERKENSAESVTDISPRASRLAKADLIKKVQADLIKKKRRSTNEQKESPVHPLKAAYVSCVINEEEEEEGEGEGKNKEYKIAREGKPRIENRPCTYSCRR